MALNSRCAAPGVSVLYFLLSPLVVLQAPEVYGGPVFPGSGVDGTPAFHPPPGLPTGGSRHSGQIPESAYGPSSGLRPPQSGSIQDYDDEDYDYDENHAGVDNYDDPGGQLPPPPDLPNTPNFGVSQPPKPSSPDSHPSTNERGQKRITCTHYDSKDPTPFIENRRRWRRKLGRRGKRRRRRRHRGEEKVQCDTSCFTMWQMDHTNSPVILKQGCANNYCSDNCRIEAAYTSRGSKGFFCCCNSDNCNKKLHVPRNLTNIAKSRTGGEKFVREGSGAGLNSGERQKRPSNPSQSSSAHQDNEDERSQKFHVNPVLPSFPNQEIQVASGTDGGGFLFCANYNGTNTIWRSETKPYNMGQAIELDKRVPPHTAGEAERKLRSMLARSHDDGGKPILGQPFGDNSSIICGPDSFCFTVWTSDPRDKSVVSVQMQGCWLSSDTLSCQHSSCEARDPPRQNNTHFCCCHGHRCNRQFRDIYDPAKHFRPRAKISTTVRTPPEAIGPIRDHSYRETTIAVALFLFLSISLVTVLTYLVYRLCLSSKRTSPLSSSVGGTRTDTDLTDSGGTGGGSGHSSLDNLKVQDLLVRGRYSEVRKGTLDGLEVAVKYYQHHHRQYYFNEKSAFTLPFMEHENLVKFLGAAEKSEKDRDSDVEQSSEMEVSMCGMSRYMVVTELATLGSLTGYLKHNTLDWYMLCHMCQGVCSGLTHLHTDISRAGLFKPAIAHRDINTRNILVKADLTCVVADLGFAVGVMGSKIIHNGVAEVAEQSSLADVGTLRYMAPEVFDGAVNLRDCEASLKQVDVYALGLVIWEMASRCADLYQGAPVPDYELPYQAEAGNHPLFEELQVLVVKYKTRPKFPHVWKDTHPAVRSLKETIEDCWDSDAEARLTALCVLERIADMSALWVQGSNRKREVKPCLNTSSSRPSSCTPVVTNGVSVLPSYVDDSRGRCDSLVANRSELNQHGASSVGERKADDIDTLPATSYRRAGCINTTTANGVGEEEDGVTAPLIVGSPAGQLRREKLSWEDDTSPYEDRQRVRAWLQDQSMSGSTMDTLLPMTPLSDRNRNLLSSDGTAEENCLLLQHTGTSQSSDRQAHVKTNNVTLAQKHGVIVHPNQGRNPTVERNTHKRSDEELAVSGNHLLGSLDSHSSTGSEKLGPLAKRKGSLEPTVAGPRGVQGEPGRSTLDSGGELSSLVQHDALGHTQSQHHHHQPPVRNAAPIPYVQNQVHRGDGPGQTRHKQANNAFDDDGDNRSSYINGHGSGGLLIAHPQPIMPDKLDGSDTKSVKNMLSRLIRPKDLGHKFSLMVFGNGGITGTGRRNKSNKKNQDNHSGGGGGDRGVSESSVPRNSQAVGDGSRPYSHYDNIGLQASPPHRASSEEARIHGPGTYPITVANVPHLVPHTPQPVPNSASSVPTVLQSLPIVPTAPTVLPSVPTIPSSVSNVPMPMELCNGETMSRTGNNQVASAPYPGTTAAISPMTGPAGARLSATNVAVANLDGNNAQSSLFLSHNSKGASIFPGAHRISSSPDLPSKQNHDIAATVETSTSASHPLQDFNQSVPAVFSQDKALAHVQNASVQPVRFESDTAYSSGSQEQTLHLEGGKCPQQVSHLGSPPSVNQSNSSHQNKLRKDGDDFTRLGMSRSWHEAGLNKGQNSRPRPKFLSLKGHNYDKKKSWQALGGKLRAEGVTISSPSSLPSTYIRSSSLSSLSDHACEVPHYRGEFVNGMENTSATKTELKNCVNGNTSWQANYEGRESSNSNNRDISHSTIPMVAPNVTISRSFPGASHQVSSGGLSMDPPLSVLPVSGKNSCGKPGASGTLPSYVTSAAGSNSFKPIEVSNMAVPGQAGDHGEEHKQARHGTLPSSLSAGHLGAETGPHVRVPVKSEDVGMDTTSSGYLESCHSIVRPDGNSGNIERDTCTRHSGVKMRKASSTLSDSSDKIRRRIKTPVSFKNGRLSLYDDRLMTQSLDSAVLYHTAGEEV